MIDGPGASRAAVHPECCFGCAAAPAGLGFELELAGERLQGTFTFPERFQGPTGIAHSGLVATVLDEACSQIVGLAIGPNTTTRIEVRHLAPVPVEEAVRVAATIVEQGERRVTGEATIVDEAGFMLAHARVECIPTRPKSVQATATR